MSKKQVKKLGYDDQGYYLAPYPQTAYDAIAAKHGTDAADERKRRYEKWQGQQNEKLIKKQDAELKLRARAVEQIKDLPVDRHFSQLDMPGLPACQAKQVIRNCCRQGLGTEHEVDLPNGEKVLFLMRTNKPVNNAMNL